jgi:hypothetical protein
MHDAKFDSLAAATRGGELAAEWRELFARRCARAIAELDRTRLTPRRAATTPAFGLQRRRELRIAVSVLSPSFRVRWSV